MTFGNDLFGSGPFGRDDWSTSVLVDLVPDIYKTADADIDGQFFTLLETIVPTFDYFIEKINKLYQLRDPLECPVDTDFLHNVIIIKVDNLGDGTSIVYLSQNSDGKVFDGVRIGFVLTDSSDSQFEIIQVRSSDLSSDVNSAPIDPFTGNPSGKNLIVKNISLSNLEVIPLVSGDTFTTTSTNLTPPSSGVSKPDVLTVTPLDDGVNSPPYTLLVGAYPIVHNLVTVTWLESGDRQTGYFNNEGKYFGNFGVGTTINYDTGTIIMVPASGGAADNLSISITYTTATLEEKSPLTAPLNDGVNLGPYVFTVAQPPLTAARVTAVWTEGATVKRGSFNSSGTPSGDLHAASTINFTTGIISLKNLSGAAIDASSIDIRYLPLNGPLDVDSTITQQNLLAILAKDYGVTVDQHEPEEFQRSSVYNAYQLWDIKGSNLGYKSLGLMAGFDVNSKRLYKISSAFGAQFITDGKPVFNLAGLFVDKEVPGTDPTNSITPTNDGISAGPFTIAVSYVPIFTVATPDAQPRVILSWTEAFSNKSVSYNTNTAVLDGDTTSIVSYVQSDTGVVVTFDASHVPDVGSIKISYCSTAFYTTLAPKTLILDDVVLDANPLDMYCADNDFSTIDQTIDVIGSTSLGAEGGSTRWLTTASTAAYGDAYLTLGTEGVLLSLGKSVENFARTSNTTFTFEIVNATAPLTTPGDVLRWNVLKNIRESATDNPATTVGTTISPNEDGVTLGPFTIGLANIPLSVGTISVNDHVIIAWTESAVTKTAFVTGTNTLGGTNAANISSASINRTTGILTVTFAVAHPPDADSIRITYRPKSDIAIIGVGTDLTVLGVQYAGHTGVRYRLRISLSDTIAIGNVGNWKIIDSSGVQSWIEKIALISASPFVYDLEFVSNTLPSAGPANIFYSCEEFPSCLYCAASAIRVVITANKINNFPELALDVASGAAPGRFIERLKEIIPMHVKLLPSYLTAGFTWEVV